MIVQLNLKRLQIFHNLFDTALALICNRPIAGYGCQLEHVPNKVPPYPKFLKIYLIHKLIKMLQFSKAVGF